MKTHKAEFHRDRGDVETYGLTVSPVIPAELHGFYVTVGIAPYPPDQPRSHRRAMYADLRPATDANRAKLKRAGRVAILATVPLTVEAADEIQTEPDGELAEIIARRAVAEASKLARLVNNA